jgi:DNA polymerase V
VLPQPSSYTPTLLNYANQGLNKIFRSGFAYKKAGVLLGGLVSATNYQQNLFVKQDPEKDARQAAAMALLDQANQKFGYKILQFASEGIDRPWKMQQDNLSSCFTTQWSQLLTIQI